MEPVDARQVVAREDERLAVTWHDHESITAMLEAAGFVDVEIGAAPGAAALDEARWTVTARIPAP